MFVFAYFHSFPFSVSLQFNDRPLCVSSDRDKRPLPIAQQNYTLCLFPLFFSFSFYFLDFICILRSSFFIAQQFHWYIRETNLSFFSFFPMFFFFVFLEIVSHCPTELYTFPFPHVKIDVFYCTTSLYYKFCIFLLLYFKRKVHSFKKHMV